MSKFGILDPQDLIVESPGCGTAHSVTGEGFTMVAELQSERSSCHCCDVTLPIIDKCFRFARGVLLESRKHTIYSRGGCRSDWCQYPLMLTHVCLGFDRRGLGRNAQWSKRRSFMYRDGSLGVILSS